jgi:hypothetical protein
MSTELDLHDDVVNPLDSVEEILASNNWAFNRTNPDELMVQVTGKAGTYRLFFLWQEDMSALQFCCQYDMVVPAANREAACRALVNLNESLWMGHFDIPHQTNIPSFRQTCLFRGSTKGDASEHIEDLVDISLAQCERYYPLFHFLAHSSRLDEQNLNLAVMETAGES